MTAKVVNILTGIVALLVFAIGAGAFTLSYDALYETGSANGIASGKAWLWPLLIDAPLIVFTLALLVFQLMRQSVKLWAGLVILYTALTIGLNLSHAVSTWLGWTVAIVAPVGLLLTTEALRHLAKLVIERQATLLSLEELTGEVDKLARQRDTLSGQVEALRVDREALSFQQISPKLDTLNAARQEKKQERLDTLLGYLDTNPAASLTEAAQEVGVSRQTISGYVNELTQDGRLHKNGNGWEVSR